MSQQFLLNGATATTTGNPASAPSPDRTYQATVVGTGSVSATVIIEGSNDGSSLSYLTIGTITLSGTTSASDGFVSTASWSFVRARLTAISGTGAAVNATMGA